MFTHHVAAHAEHADLVLSISEDTAASYRAWRERDGRRVPPVAVVPLGTDEPVELDPLDPLHRGDLDLPVGIDGVPFLITVGTVEPRKNHAALLDAFRAVRDDHPELHLVVVGRPGWRNEETIGRLEHLDATDHRVHWLRSASDAELEVLYRTAFAVVAPSFTEGFGLPVVEALARGAVVLSSTGGALVEAGGDAVEYFEPDDPAELARLIRLHLEDPAHHAARVEAAAAHPRRAWSEVAADVGAALGAALASFA